MPLNEDSAFSAAFIFAVYPIGIKKFSISKVAYLAIKLLKFIVELSNSENFEIHHFQRLPATNKHTYEK